MLCFSFPSRPDSAARSPASHTHRCYTHTQTPSACSQKKKCQTKPNWLNAWVCACVRTGPGARQQAAVGTRASAHGGHAAEAEEGDADGRGVAGAGGEATGGDAQTHTYLCCVFKIKRNGHSFFLCIAVESYGATKLACQGTLAILFFLSAFSKDTSVDVFDLSAPLDCQSHLHFCLQNPLVQQGSYVKVR